MNKVDFLTSIGLNLKIMIAGFAGGLCNALVFRQTDPYTVVASVIVGTLSANYLGPLAFQMVGNWIGEPGSGFFVGLGGMALCQALVELAKKYKAPTGGTDETRHGP